MMGMLKMGNGHVDDGHDVVNFPPDLRHVGLLLLLHAVGHPDEAGELTEEAQAGHGHGLRPQGRQLLLVDEADLLDAQGVLLLAVGLAQQPLKQDRLIW